MAKRTEAQSRITSKKPEKRFVLEMSAVDARKFFLKSESYCNVDLPKYFQFDKILSNVAEAIKGNSLADMRKCSPRQHEEVNYLIMSNKDGRYAWRPYQLIHPALYVSLVDQITKPDNWKFIFTRFERFHELKNFNCLSMPVLSLSKRKDKAAQILHWWQEIEQASIELALEYEYVFHADITDCYGSIYTHSIAWALHDKEEAKRCRKDKKLIGNIIDGHIQDMRHGQTNGIPQGSVLMDFIAEMVLGYADLQLSEKLDRASVTEYRILRYRDDYRIFLNNPQSGEAILKALTEVLIGLGLKLNTSKTTGALSIISSSLKPDKLAWLCKRQGDKNIQKHLLVIHAHGLDYPNSGSLEKALIYFNKRLSLEKRPQNPCVLISITVDIAYSSPRTIRVCAAIVSRLLQHIKNDDKRGQILAAVHRKLSKMPNTGLMEVWLQRIGHFYKFAPSGGYTEELCKLATEGKAQLWNNNWIREKKLEEALNPANIFNEVKFKKAKRVISPSEIELFARY